MSLCAWLFLHASLLCWWDCTTPAKLHLPLLMWHSWQSLIKHHFNGLLTADKQKQLVLMHRSHSHMHKCAYLARFPDLMVQVWLCEGVWWWLKGVRDWIWMGGMCQETRDQGWMDVQGAQGADEARQWTGGWCEVGDSHGHCPPSSRRTDYSHHLPSSGDLVKQCLHYSPSLPGLLTTESLTGHV